jgi:regulator of protease activity HflC (stomatin/prohibitin superfamily)
MQRSTNHPAPRVPSGAKILGGALVAAILLSIIGFFVFTTRVSAGQGCLLVSFGKIQEPIGPGLHFRVPGKDDKKCFSTRKQTYELVSGDPKSSDSRADYKDWAIAGKTAEGIDFWVMLTVQYHIPVENVATIYQGVGKTDERVQEQVVKFHTRAIVPQVLNTYAADQLYIGDLTPISAQIFAELAPRFAAQGVVLDYFELKRGDFDDSYEAAIRNKAQITEQVKQKEVEQRLATEEAERVRIEREGAANAAAAESRIAQEQANANTVTAAQAEAQAIAVVGQAYEENPSALERERIAATANANVVYLPSEGVLPILGIEDPGNQP